MKKFNSSKISFTGLGIIFGSAIGSMLSLIITGSVIWGLIGTSTGLIIGACIDSYKNKS